MASYAPQAPKMGLSSTPSTQGKEYSQPWAWRLVRPPGLIPCSVLAQSKPELQAVWLLAEHGCDKLLLHTPRERTPCVVCPVHTSAVCTTETCTGWPRLRDMQRRPQGAHGQAMLPWEACMDELTSRNCACRWGNSAAGRRLALLLAPAPSQAAAEADRASGTPPLSCLTDIDN